MDNLILIVAGILGVAAIPALRQAIKSYRARKSAADIIVDAIEAAIDEVERSDTDRFLYPLPSHHCCPWWPVWLCNYTPTVRDQTTQHAGR